MFKINKDNTLTVKDINLQNIGVETKLVVDELY